MGLEVLYQGEESPSAIALDDRFIYWASREALRRAPLAGGDAVTLANGRVRGMLLDAEHVYFHQSFQGSGSIERVPREGGESVLLASVLQPSALAIRGGDLFWSDLAVVITEGSINRALLDGSAASVLASGLAQPSSLAIDAEHLYFRNAASGCAFSGEQPAECFGGGIQRLPIGGGAVEPVTTTDARGDFVIGESGLYWLASSPPRMMLAQRAGGEREVAGDLIALGISGAGSLRTDGVALYWADDDKVLRMPFDTEEVAVIASGLEGADDVAIRADWVYVTERSAGRILRVATDGSANRPAGPITGPCPAPIGSVEELARTPRADENLEALALSLEPENISATQGTYDRIVSDVAAIRALAPALADIDYRSGYGGRSLYVALSAIGAQSVAAGEYSAWDCLNEAYRASAPRPRESFGNHSAFVELGGVFNLPLVANLYSQLPEVTAAEPSSGAVGDGPTLCVSRAGEHYEYVVDDAGGDCPSGCTEHEAYGFASDTAGQVTALGVWSSVSGEIAPAWFGAICN